MKRYHEAPLSIFKDVQKVTDGDYALVHLFRDNPDYLEVFRKAVAEGRDVILDNSLFELREPFDPDLFMFWIKNLKPTWYIVPDCWKNGKKTSEMFHQFMDRYYDLPGKAIGVAQGNDTAEVAECYKSIEPRCDMVAFSLDFASYSGLPAWGVPYPIRMSIGRTRIVKELYEQGIINTNKPHHLLGCGVPQEVMWYPIEWKNSWLRSIDTCNPVIHGMQGVRYNPDLPGLATKSSTKMCDKMDAPVCASQLKVVMENIEMMREMVEFDG